MVDGTEPEAVADFSHVSRLRVEGKLRWFSLGLDCLPGARLRGKCATFASNVEYGAAFVRASAESYPRAGETDVQAVLRNWEIVCRLWPRHVIVGWEKVIDAKGVEQAFSPERCEALLRALPSDTLEAVMGFFRKPANFHGDIDDVALSGNSSAGSSGS